MTEIEAMEIELKGITSRIEPLVARQRVMVEELRRLKSLKALKLQVHEAFDSTWGTRKRSKRQAYRWLQGEMEMTPSQCHIEMFDEQQCRKVLLLCE